MATSSRFDQISRDLARTTTRRQMLGVALAGLAGLFGGLLARRTAEAATPDHWLLTQGENFCIDEISYFRCSVHQRVLCPGDTICQDAINEAYCKYIA